MKILFATDGSQHATGAARFLNRLAAKAPIDLTVMTVTYRPDNVDTPSVKVWFPDWQRAEQSRIDAHYQELDILLQRVRGSVHMLRSEGSPVPLILETAKEHGTDLIVLGARGHSTLERALLGSVSDAIATHAQCSVLVVRPPQDRAVVATQSSTVSYEPQEPERSGLRLTLAVDGSTGSQAAVEELRQWEWSPNACLQLLSIASMPDYLGPGYALGQPQDYELERLREANTAMLAELKLMFRNVVPKVTHGLHVGDTIVNVAAADGADVIVLGKSGHSRFAELLLGSTTKYVLRHAACSVWISRFNE